MILLVRILATLAGLGFACRYRFVLAWQARKAGWVVIPLLGFCVACTPLPEVQSAGGPTRTPRSITLVQKGTPPGTPAPSATLQPPTATLVPSATPSPSPTSTPTPTATPTLTPTVPALTPQAVIGQDMAVGELVYRVLQVTDLGNVLKTENPFDLPIRTDGKFLRVSLRVNNGSQEQVYLDDGDLSIVDGEGRAFRPSRQAAIRQHIPQGEDWCVVALPPKGSKQCHVIYELPSEAQGLKLKVASPGGLAGVKEAVVDLNPAVALPPEVPTPVAEAAAAPPAAAAAPPAAAPPGAAAPPAAAAPATKPTLRRGASGPAVEELQRRLNRWLAATPSAGLPQLAVDGVFGPRTEAAVRAFQSASSLAPDGLAGSTTWERLPPE